MPVWRQTHPPETMDQCRVHGDGEGLACSACPSSKRASRQLQVQQICHRLHIDCQLSLPHQNTLKYLQDAVSGISTNINLFLPYRKSHSMSKIPKFCSLLHYIECMREVGSADNSDTERSEAAHKNLMKDDYHSSNKVNYIPQILP